MGDVLLVVDHQHPPARAVHCPTHRAHAVTHPGPSSRCEPPPRRCAGTGRTLCVRCARARPAGRTSVRPRWCPAGPAAGTGAAAAPTASRSRPAPGRRPPAGTTGSRARSAPRRDTSAPSRGRHRQVSTAPGRCGRVEADGRGRGSPAGGSTSCRNTGSAGRTGAAPARGSYETRNETSCRSPRPSVRSSTSSVATRPGPAPAALGHPPARPAAAGRGDQRAQPRVVAVDVPEPVDAVVRGADPGGDPGAQRPARPESSSTSLASVTTSTCRGPAERADQVGEPGPAGDRPVLLGRGRRPRRRHRRPAGHPQRELAGRQAEHPLQREHPVPADGRARRRAGAGLPGPQGGHARGQRRVRADQLGGQLPQRQPVPGDRVPDRGRERGDLSPAPARVGPARSRRSPSRQRGEQNTRGRPRRRRPSGESSSGTGEPQIGHRRARRVQRARALPSGLDWTADAAWHHSGPELRRYPPSDSKRPRLLRPVIEWGNGATDGVSRRCAIQDACSRAYGPSWVTSSACGPRCTTRPGVDDEHLVGALRGGQPVRDDHRGPAAGHRVQRAGQPDLGGRVDRAGRLVQHQQVRVGRRRPGPARPAAAPPPTAPRRARPTGVCRPSGSPASQSASPSSVKAAAISSSVASGRPNRTLSATDCVEQEAVLRHHHHPGPQRGEPHLGQRHAADAAPARWSGPSAG